MSDERKDLLKHFKEITIEYHQHCEWTEDKYSAVEKIEQLIQHQPEIDDMKKYVKKKAESMCFYVGLREGVSLTICEEFVSDIISDTKGRGIEVDKAFVENWRKRFFLLLIKFEEKGLLDDDDKTVLRSLEVNLDNFISEMLTEAKVEIKK